ncbi:MAG: type I-U CRISPR-associated protein Cas7 [Planctomycetota bacterium]|nr:MAG: type I-U CRISPR-associated protein Cas7 [Planctomycetota bacterium]
MTTHSIDDATLNAWATDPQSAVALHLRQELLPVEGRGAVFFPPTFAGGDYNIDKLADGTSVALVDSVGSQANRMEPIFLEEQLRHLIPQITIEYGDAKKETDGSVSLLEAGHRLGDAVVRSTELHAEAQAAFKAMLRSNDAGPLAKLAPTSIVFGVWDSRDTGAKVPRIVQSVIRAWDVSKLQRSAQYTPTLDYAALEVFSDAEREKAEGKSSSPLAERGFVHVPAVGSHGGVVAKGPIVRDVTVNLIALRRLGGPDADLVRKYVLGLALLAAIAPQDPFLRQGCLLVPDAETPAEWTIISRDGTRSPAELAPDVVLSYATAAAEAFGVGEARTLQFDKKLAKADTKAKSK